MFKKILKKAGLDFGKKTLCIKCKKELEPDQKRCPYCHAWNDCCSPDPEKIAKLRAKMGKE